MYQISKAHSCCQKPWCGEPPHLLTGLNIYCFQAQFITVSLSLWVVCTLAEPSPGRGSSSGRSYGGSSGGRGSSASSSSGSGLMKVSPDTVCTLVKQTSRNGNQNCFDEQECGQKCSTVNEQQCNTVNEQKCSTVNEQQCSTVNKQQCSTVNEQKCSTVNEQKCSTGKENIQTYIV